MGELKPLKGLKVPQAVEAGRKLNLTTTRRGKPYKTYPLAAVERAGVMGRVPRAELRMTRRLVEHLAKLSDTP